MEIRTRQTKRKTRKNKNKNQKGGTLKGKGGFGCVYKPPLRCKGEEHRPENTISKLLYTKDMEKEIGEYETMKQIDRLGEFHIQVSKTCEPNDLDPEEDGDINECTPIINKLNNNNIPIDEWKKHSTVLYFKDGGKPLNVFLTEYQKNTRDLFILQNLNIKCMEFDSCTLFSRN